MKDQYKIDGWINWYKTIQKAFRSLNGVTQAYDISFEQFLVLSMVAEKPEISSTEIGKLMNISAPAISRKLNILKDKGLIIKIRGKGIDQRIMEIQLTDKGYQIYNIIGRSFLNLSLDKLNLE